MIKAHLYIGNFNVGTPYHHHCILSSNLLSVLKGREVCSIISLLMYIYWIILILTLISNVPICKFKYQSMIIMQIIICLIIMQTSICLIIVQTTICLIMMKILYSCHSYNVVILMHSSDTLI